MPRKRKPLAMQSKHLTTAEKVNIEQQEQVIITGREQLEKPPSWLINVTAKKEYKRLIKEFETIEVVGNLDLNNLGGYCNAYAFYLQATKELKGQPLTIEKMTKEGTATVRNPLIDIQKNYAEEMRKFASLCGLTIDSRLKVATVKTTKQAQEVEKDFGDI